MDERRFDILLYMGNSQPMSLLIHMEQFDFITSGKQGKKKFTEEYA
jgi:hypothetical protein